MTFRITNISVILFITTVVNFYTTTIAWQRRKTKGGAYFAWGMAGVTLWTLASTLDYAAVPIPTKVFYAKIEALGSYSALALLTMFALSYTGHEEWLKKIWVKAFFILYPLTNIALTWTNEFHNLIWSGFTRSEIGNNIVVFHHGPAFTGAVIVGYAMIALNLTVLWQASRQGSELSRRQARLLLMALSFPIISNIIYQLGFQTMQGIDWTSITFSISGVFMLTALYGTRFLDLVPVARHTTIERMSDCVLVLDPYNQIIDFNQAAVDTFEMGEDPIGKPLEEVISGWPEMIALASSRSTETTQAITLHSQGETVFDARMTLLKDGRGQLFGKLLVFRDISKQYQAERALAERVKELNCIYNLSLLVERPDISLDEILQGGVNLIAAAMQYPQLACAKLSLDDRVFVTENYQDTPMKLINEVSIAGRGVGALEVGYLPNPDEGDYPHFIQEEKNLLYIMAERLGNAIQNLQAEEKLRQSEERYRTVADYTYDWGYWRAPDGEILYISPSCERITGYTPEEFIHNPGLLESIVIPEDRPTLGAHKANSSGEASEDGLHKADFRIMRCDGEIRWIAHTCQHIRSKDGTNLGVRATNRDITEQKQIEAALQKTQTYLIEQQRELARNEERQRMARDLHDSVNQSLHSLKLFSETLVATIGKENFERAGQIAERVQESARQSFKETRLMLHELQDRGPGRVVNFIEDLETRLGRVERRAGVRANIIQEGSPLPCPQELHENLYWIAIEALNNTLKHAQASQVQIFVRCTPQRTEVEIIDDGIGFDTSKRQYAGMGLENMRQRAALLNGELTVESTPGEGTCVRLTVGD